MDKEKYYKYYINLPKGEVIAVCRYAGRTIKGKAKCAPEDNFDLEKGKKLATARAELKVHTIKYKNSIEKFKAMQKKLKQTKKEFEAAKKYFYDSIAQVNFSMLELNTLERSI